MNVIQELALLAVVATPAAVIAALNLALYLAGERGTLLLPDRAVFPGLALEPMAAIEAEPAGAWAPAAEDEMRLAA